MNKYNNLLFKIEENIAFITINRPDKMNALNILTIQEIGKAFDEVYNNNDIKGSIITGSGNKAFIAGADIAEFADFTKEQAFEMSGKGHDVFNKIENCPKPVIAAVNGFALGGGCELAMACHIRVASDNAKFGQPEVALGVIPGYGGTQRLTHLVGKGKAMELILTGDMIKADESYRLGLVNCVVSPEELINKSKEIINKILKNGPLAVAKSIFCINTVQDKDINGFIKEIAEFSNCFETADFKEGTSAFLNKKSPKFTAN